MNGEDGDLFVDMDNRCNKARDSYGLINGSDDLGRTLHPKCEHWKRRARCTFTSDEGCLAAKYL